MNHKTWQ